ncbi:hypothetical protein [Caulobacter segnis]
MESMAVASTQTDTRERVDVAEGGEPAAADVDTGEAKAVEQSAPPRRLATFERMAAILDECDAIGKQDIQMEKDGKKWSIKGHTVEAVLSEIRPLFSKHGLSIMPSLVERSYAGNRCDVIIDWKFRALDDRDDIEIVRWAGAGTDNGDKAFSKAGTNCLKEMLKKTFLVSDRDDAKEEEDKVEHQTEEGINRAEMERQAEAKRAAFEAWAKAFKKAVETAGSAEEVKALQRENRETLASKDLPSVTREFFVKLIQDQITKFSGKGGGAAEEAPADAD